MPNSEEKFMVFIDGSNMFHGSKTLKIMLDYKKFRDLLKIDRKIIRIYYYEGYPIPMSKPKENFYKKLREFEITLDKKPLRKRPYECEKCGNKKDIYYEKGIDASLSTDLLWHAFQGSYDTAILLTGDDDYAPPIRKVKSLGKRVELWTFKDRIGREMKEIADRINFIDDIIDKVKR